MVSCLSMSNFPSVWWSQNQLVVFEVLSWAIPLELRPTTAREMAERTPIELLGWATDFQGPIRGVYFCMRHTRYYGMREVRRRPRRPVQTDADRSDGRPLRRRTRPRPHVGPFVVDGEYRISIPDPLLRGGRSPSSRIGFVPIE